MPEYACEGMIAIDREGKGTIFNPSISERMLRPVAVTGDHGDPLGECRKLRR